MNMPLLCRADRRGVFGKHEQNPQSSITDALFVYLDGVPETESMDRVDSCFCVRPLVCLTKEWKEQIRKQYPDAAIYRRTTMKPACRFTVADQTYLTGTAASAILYFVLGSGGNLLKEYGKLNWASFALGIVIVGLEAGWIFAYKAGWNVSTGFFVQSAFLAAALLFVGYFLYHETLTWNKLAGVAFCLIGLVIINLR